MQNTNNVSIKEIFRQDVSQATTMSLPLALALMCRHAQWLVCLIFAGKVGQAEMAGVGLSLAFMAVVQFFIMGFVYMLDSMLPHAVGASTLFGIFNHVFQRNLGNSI